MTIDTCPDQQTLQQYLLGLVQRGEAELLDEHFRSCESCLRLADSLTGQDGLTAAIRAGRSTDASDQQPISELILSLKSQFASSETVQFDETMESQPDRFEATLNATQLPNQPSDSSFLAPPQREDEIGRLGNYRILSRLGAGGMGVVFRAEDLTLKRIVAVKAMHPNIATNKSSKERFLREAQATAAIEHDNIVTIYQVGEDRDVPFLAMQFLQGESLQDRLDREGRLDESEVLRIGREAASGLAAAHRRGLIHRDIKPDNIWLEQSRGSLGEPNVSITERSTTGSRVKIVDFGLVRTHDDTGLTQSGAILGTPRYMSPEQAHGKPVDCRSDLFSLGSVLYHLATGKPPFHGSNLTAILIAVSQEDPEDVRTANPDVSPQLAELISRLLCKDRELRFESAAAVVREIQGIEAGKALNATPAPRVLPNIDTSITKSPSSKSRVGKPHTVAKTLNTARPPVWKTPIALAGIGAAFLIAALGIVVISVGFGKGTLVVKAADGVKVEIKNAQVTIRDKETGATYQLAIGEESMKPGDYELVVNNPASGLTFSTKQFTIKRGDVTQVEVTLQEAVPDAAPKMVAESAERRAAEWVLSVGGRVFLNMKSGHGNSAFRTGQALPDEPFDVRDVNIEHSSTVTDEGMTNLRGLTGLLTLSFFDSPISDQGLANMTDEGRVSFPNLRDLWAADTKVTDKGLRYFSDSKQLKSMDLMRTRARDASVFRNFPNLGTLGIALTEIPSSDLAVLETLDSLTYLAIDGSQLAGEGARHIGALKKLISLTVEKAQSPSKFDSAILNDRHSLSRLNVYADEFDVMLWPSLAKLSKLKELTLLGKGLANASIESMETLPSLRILRLSNARLNGESVAAAAHRQPLLKELSIEVSPLTDADVKALESLTKLDQIRLGSCGNISAQAIDSLRKAVPHCKITSDHGTFEPLSGERPSG